MHRFYRIIVFVTLLAPLALPAFAQSTEGVLEIHGFGGWAYGKTDGHKYSLGRESGDYDNAEFALNIASTPADRLSVVAQVRLDSRTGGKQVDLDYAFAEWRFSDAARVRAGRVKHPFGIYGEVFDVGTVRPFFTLPQSLYGANGFTARAYNGAGFTGNVALGHWGVQYDVYGGQIEGDFETPGLLSTVSSLFAEPAVKFGYRVENSYGGRLNVSTPVDGLTFGTSGYTGQAYTDLSEVANAQRDVYAAHAEYARGGFAIRSEIGHLKNGRDFVGDSRYVETSYRIGQHWQVAGRWDQLEVTLPTTNLSRLPKIFGQVLDHEETAIGLSYWFTPGFVVRGSVHRVDGNRFAFPETGDEVMAALVSDSLDRKTNLVLVGAQFSF